MVRLIPSRLKSHNGKNGVDGASHTASRGSSPLRSGFDGKNMVLKTTVLRVRKQFPGGLQCMEIEATKSTCLRPAIWQQRIRPARAIL